MAYVPKVLKKVSRIVCHIYNIGHYFPESLSDYRGDKWRESPLTEQELLAGLPVTQRTLKDGETARAVGAQLLRDEMGAQINVASS